jgi:hypothetical protein
VDDFKRHIWSSRRIWFSCKRFILTNDNPNEPNLVLIGRWDMQAYIAEQVAENAGRPRAVSGRKRPPSLLDDLRHLDSWLTETTALKPEARRVRLADIRSAYADVCVRPWR